MSSTNAAGGQRATRVLTEILAASGVAAEVCRGDVVEPLFALATSKLAVPDSMRDDQVLKIAADLLFVKALTDKHRDSLIAILAEALRRRHDDVWTDLIWSAMRLTPANKNCRWFPLTDWKLKKSPLAAAALRLIQDTPDWSANSPNELHSAVQWSLRMSADFVEAATLWDPTLAEVYRASLRCVFELLAEDLTSAFLTPRWPVAELLVDSFGSRLKSRMSATDSEIEERVWCLQLFGSLSCYVAYTCPGDKTLSKLDNSLEPVRVKLAMSETGADLDARVHAWRMVVLGELRDQQGVARAFRAALWRRALQLHATSLRYTSETRGAALRTAIEANEVRRVAMLSSLTTVQSTAVRTALTANEFRLVSWRLAISWKPCFAWYLYQNPWKLDSDTGICFPANVCKLQTSDGAGVVYLVGTAHVSRLAADIVSLVIRAVQPHVVCLELDDARAGLLSETVDDDANARFGEMGVDMRRAQREARLLHSEVRYIDRDIATTQRLMWRSMSCCTRVMCIAVLCLLPFASFLISSDDLESSLYNNDNEVEPTDSDADFGPEIERILKNERNTVLAYRLQLAAREDRVRRPGLVTRVVGVLGAAHLCGVRAQFGRVTDAEASTLLKVPPPLTRSERCNMCTILVSVGIVLLLVLGFVIICIASVAVVRRVIRAIKKWFRLTNRF